MMLVQVLLSGQAVALILISVSHMLLHRRVTQLERELRKGR